MPIQDFTAGPPIGETGERATIAVIAETLRAVPSTASTVRIGIGDDAAVLRHRGDTVVSTDTMIEGTDFRRDWHDPEALGWKLAATNLSDVWAMGATPTALTVALACPDSLGLEAVRGIARGLASACAELAPGCAVVGGDLSLSPVMVVSVTALGDLDGRPPVQRSGAQPGDQLVYAGELGSSGWGLALLRQASGDGTLSLDALDRLKAEHPDALRAHLTPRPPGEAAARAAARLATAMLDVSDGLTLDAARIAEASGVSVDLARDLLTELAPAVPLAAVLGGGEDHGLLATLPAHATPPPGFHRIGTVHRPPMDGSPSVALDGEPLAPAGWDPFADAFTFPDTPSV